MAKIKKERRWILADVKENNYRISEKEWNDVKNVMCEDTIITIHPIENAGEPEMVIRTNNIIRLVTAEFPVEPELNPID